LIDLYLVTKKSTKAPIFILSLSQTSIGIILRINNKIQLKTVKSQSIINVIINLWIQLILYLEVKSHIPPFYRGGKSLEVSGWLNMSTAYSD